MPGHWDVRTLDSSEAVVIVNHTQNYKGNFGHGPQPTHKQSCQTGSEGKEGTMPTAWLSIYRHCFPTLAGHQSPGGLRA